MRAALPYIVVVVLIGLALWFALAILFIRPTGGGLLLLIGMKLGLLGNRVFDRLVEPINRQLIGDGGRQSPVLFQPLVEFHAFFTHDSHRICAS